MSNIQAGINNQYFSDMRKILVLVSFILVFVSCKNQEQKTEHTSKKSNTDYNEIKRLQWLVDNWTNITPDQQSYENWKQKNDSTLTAYSYTTVLNDTVFQENVTVQQTKDGVVFIVSVPDQNDEKPVTFDMIPSVNGVFTFENKQHDFPNRISYSNPVKDSIHAWIEGGVDSTYKKIDFYFKRSNE